MLTSQIGSGVTPPQGFLTGDNQTFGGNGASLRDYAGDATELPEIAEIAEEQGAADLSPSRADASGIDRRALNMVCIGRDAPSSHGIGSELNWRRARIDWMSHCGLTSTTGSTSRPAANFWRLSTVTLLTERST